MARVECRCSVCNEVMYSTASVVPRNAICGECIILTPDQRIEKKREAEEMARNVVATVKSSSGRGTYKVSYDLMVDKWACSCPGWTKRSPRIDCRHIKGCLLVMNGISTDKKEGVTWNKIGLELVRKQKVKRDAEVVGITMQLQMSERSRKDVFDLKPKEDLIKAKSKPKAKPKVRKKPKPKLKGPGLANRFANLDLDDDDDYY